MALSGTIKGTTSNKYITAQITWSATQSKANNTSTITAELFYKKSNLLVPATYGTLKGEIIIAGVSTSVSKYVTLHTNEWISIGTATTTVSHKDDGSASIVISAKGAISGTSFTSTTIGQTITLDTISMATTPVLSNASPTIGNSITITLNRVSTNLTHTLSYTFGSASGTIGTGIATSKTWTVPTSLASQFPYATSGTGTIVCQTYNGSTLVGTKSVSFTANLSSGAAPTINSVSISEGTEGLASKFGAYIKNKSKLNVSINASPSTGATITKYETYIQAVPYSGQTFTSNLITTSGNIGVTVIVTDSRGFIDSKTYTITILDYSAPTISSFVANRYDSSLAKADDGTYLGVTYKSSITSLNTKNDKNLLIEYKEASAESWTILYSSSEYYTWDSTTYSNAGVLDANKAYDVRLTVSDYFGSTIYESKISTAFTIMDFRSTGKGMGIGKASEKDRLEIAMESDFTKNVRIYAPTNNGTDDAFLRFLKYNENLLGFLSTYNNGSAIKLAMYDDSSGKNTYSGYIAIKKDGSIESSGGALSLPAITYKNPSGEDTTVSAGSSDFQVIPLAEFSNEWAVVKYTSISSGEISFNRSGTVLLSAQAKIANLAAMDRFTVGLYTNFKDDSATVIAETGAAFNTLTPSIIASISPTVWRVSEGDIIKMRVKGSVYNSSSFTVKGYPHQTYLTIQWLN